MKVEVERQPGSVSKLQIELPADEVAKEWDAIANSFARFAKIPGYRPGKAPRAVIDKRFRKEIQDELTKKLVSKSYHDHGNQHLRNIFVKYGHDFSSLTVGSFVNSMLTFAFRKSRVLPSRSCSATSSNAFRCCNSLRIFSGEMS